MFLATRLVVGVLLLFRCIEDFFLLDGFRALDSFHRPAHTVISVSLNCSFSFFLPFASFNCSPLCCFSSLSDELSDIQVDSDSGLTIDPSFWTVGLGASYVLSVVHFEVSATTSAAVSDI